MHLGKKKNMGLLVADISLLTLKKSNKIYDFESNEPPP